MNYRIKITPTASYDLQQGIDYYKSKQRGLGRSFSDKVNDTLGKIKATPLAASIAYSDVRYKVIGNFPYVILYKIEGDYIHILRFFNTYQQSGV